MPESSITIDRSDFPIVLVRYRGAPSSTDFEQYLGNLLEIYREGKSFAMVFDSSGAAPPSAVQRKLQADWISKNESLIRKLNAGTAFVTPSIVLRGALTAILWIQPLPCPHYVCADVTEAKRWARQRLDASTHRRA